MPPHVPYHYGLRCLRPLYALALQTGKNSEAEAEDNPFIEQISVYSNIDNGLGIFAGYNYYRTPEL